MSRPRLTLVIPRLFQSFRLLSTRPRLPSLETLLARATASHVESASCDARLFALFEVTAEEELPLGAVRRVGDGAAPDPGWWYCADPVHLLADRDRLHLVPPQELQIEAAEAAALAEQFNAHFAADGWRLEPLHPQRWYLRAPQRQSVVTTPLHEALSQDLRRVLPSGPDALQWHRFLNEVQMLFHGNGANQAREARGLPTINGLWPSGGGVLPRVARPFAQVWADEPTARGLAQLAGAELGALPPMLPRPAGDALAVLTPEPTADWWQWAEAQWFAPAQAMLAAGELDQLTLEIADDRAFCATRADLRRWWRRRQPVERY